MTNNLGFPVIFSNFGQPNDQIVFPRKPLGRVDSTIDLNKFSYPTAIYRISNNSEIVVEEINVRFDRQFPFLSFVLSNGMARLKAGKKTDCYLLSALDGSSSEYHFFAAASCSIKRQLDLRASPETY